MEGEGVGEGETSILGEGVTKGVGQEVGGGAWETVLSPPPGLVAKAEDYSL